MSSSRLKEKRRLTISDRLTHFKKWGITTSIGDDYISSREADKIERSEKQIPLQPKKQTPLLSKSDILRPRASRPVILPNGVQNFPQIWPCAAGYSYANDGEKSSRKCSLLMKPTRNRVGKKATTLDIGGQLTVLNSILMSVCFIYRPHSESYDTYGRQSKVGVHLARRIRTHAKHAKQDDGTNGFWRKP